MFRFLRHSAVACCLLPVAGCVTDELVVYRDSVVREEAAKPYLGVYRVEQWVGDMTPEEVVVTMVDGDLSFAYSVPGKDYEVRFVLSKIPKSDKDLHLLSIPGQQDTNQANLFFIGRTVRSETHLWAVFSHLPVAKEHLVFEKGKAKAEDVKEFLMERADAFVSANEPQVKLANPTR